jgi:amino acid permease
MDGKGVDEKGGFLSSLWNVVNTVIGAGILALPYVFKTNGVAVAGAMIPIVCLGSAISLELLTRTYFVVGAPTFEEAGKRCLGMFGQRAVEISIFLYTFGASCTYVVVMGDVFHSFFHEIGLGGIWENRWVITAIPFFLVVVPLTLLKKIRSLRFSSFLSIICVFVFMGSIIAFSIYFLVNPGKNHHRKGSFRLAEADEYLMMNVPIIWYFTLILGLFSSHHSTKINFHGSSLCLLGVCCDSLKPVLRSHVTRHSFPYACLFQFISMSTQRVSHPVQRN